MAASAPNDPAAIEATIIAVDGQRSVLGDAVVDAAIASLRERLARLAHPGVGEPAVLPQLKPVTVMFVDMVGSTALAGRLDPEDVLQVMDLALRRFTQVVQAHEGRVLQYTGDGLLAVFGADEAREHDAENAVRAGLAIIQASRESASAGPPGLSVRVGLDSGPVLLGGGIEAGGSIRGNAVNLAARMEQAAPVGGLRISNNTYRLVHGAFEFAPVEALVVKGVPDPVISHVVLRARPLGSSASPRGIQGLRTPMIGREAEWTQLTAAWRASLAGAPLRGVALLGDAGLGKSRLLGEFEAWVRVTTPAAQVLKASALPRSRQQPYALLRQLLLRALDIVEDDRADALGERVVAALCPLFDDRVDEPALAPAQLLTHLIGLDQSAGTHLRGILDDPAQIRARAFRAAVQALGRLIAAPAAAPASPALLCLDDLHWSDDGSLDFFEHWLGSLDGRRLLVVAAGRPVWIERRPQGLAAALPLQRTDLAPLDAARSVALAQALLRRLGEVPAALRELITATSDGNPFFMEEIVKMLLDEGGIVADADGAWRIAAERLRGIDEPRTLAGVLQVRLDSLGTAERIALQQAAVIGYVFWDRAVAALDERSPAALQPLAERRLVRASDQSTLHDAREFTFQHHLLQQHTYDSLLKRERRAYHARAAAWLEGLHIEAGTEFLSTIALHHERAGNVAAAVHGYTLAAQAAAARAAREAALEHTERALALLEGRDDALARWKLLAIREPLLRFQGDDARHRGDLHELAALAETLDDDVLRARSALRVADWHADCGDYAQGETAGRDALRWAERCGNASLLARSRASLSFAQRRMGRFTEALLTARQGLAQAEASLSTASARTAGADVSSRLALMGALDAVLAEQGDLVEGKAQRERALALAREAGDKFREMNLLNNIGDSLVRLGEYALAQVHFEGSLRLAELFGRRDREALAWLNLAALALLNGATAIAVTHGERAAAQCALLGARDLEAAAELPRGLALLALERLDEADAALARSCELFIANAGPHLALEPLAGRALVQLARGDTAQALRVLQPVLEHLEQGGQFNGTEEPLRIRLQCWQVLQAARDPRAAAVLQAARSELERRALRIGDEVSRRCFLHAVPHHRALLEAGDRCSSRVVS